MKPGTCIKKLNGDSFVTFKTFEFTSIPLSHFLQNKYGVFSGNVPYVAYVICVQSCNTIS